MHKIARHVERLLEFTHQRDREAYVRERGELTTPEGARALCRLAVSKTTHDMERARTLCEIIDVVARINPQDIIKGYQAHAWGAYHHQGHCDYSTAVRLWKLAHQHFEAAGQADEAAITCYCALQALHFVGEFELFSKWEEQARLHFEQTGDRLRLGRLRSNVGAMYLRQHQASEATTILEAAVGDLLVSGASPGDLCAAFGNLAVCHQLLGDLPRSGAFIDKARRLCEDEGLDHVLPSYLCNLAFVKYLQGDYYESLSILQDQSYLLDRQGLNESYMSYMAASIEAEVLRSLCFPMEAKRAARTAVRGFSRLGLKNERATALLALGGCVLDLGRPKSALAIYDLARGLFQEQSDVEGEHLADLGFATALHAAGQSRTSHQIADNLLRLEQAVSPTLAIKARLLLAEVLISEGQFLTAQKNVEAVLPRPTLLSQPPLEAEALFILATAYERSGLVSLAYEAYSRCESSLRRIRADIGLADLRIAFLSNRADIHECLFSVGLSLDHSPAHLLTLAETSKSRTLAEQLATQVHSDPGLDTTPQSREILELLRGVRASIRKVDELEQRPDRVPHIQVVRRRFSAAERATEYLLTRATQKPSALGRAAREVAESLPQDTALVEYYVARNHLYAFVANGQRLELLTLGDSRSVERLCRLVAFHVRPSSLNSSQSGPSKALLTYLRSLHDQLWSRVEVDPSVSRLVIVPHGFLHTFPFHMLYDGNQFLIDQYAVTYSPSAKVYCITRRRPQAGTSHRSVVVGVSDVNAPAIAAEVMEVAATLPNASVFVGGEANAARIPAEISNARFVHIATHGRFDRSTPRSSALSLGEATLTARDFRQLNLSAELVVLSGCETGRTGKGRSDELIGLAQAVMQAGARAAIVSMWTVADQSTATLMGHFYRQLREDRGHDVSLQAAIVSHKKDYPHPFFWAPFVLVGDPGPAPELPNTGPERDVPLTSNLGGSRAAHKPTPGGLKA